jgi:hypothetical protein
MNTLSIFTAAAIVSLASTASAQSFGGITHAGSTINFGLSLNNDQGDEPYSENYLTSVTAISRYSLNENFGVAVSLGYININEEAEYYSDRYFVDVNPYYSFGAGSIGVFYTAISHDYYDETPVSDVQYGFTADYAVNGFAVEAYAGAYFEDGEFNEDTYGLAAGYDLTDATTVYGSLRNDISDSGDEDSILSLGASYDLQTLPISLAVEFSKIGDEDRSFTSTVENQITFAASYSFGEGAQSMFRGLRAADYLFD